MRTRSKKIIANKDTWDKRLAQLVYPGTFCVMVLVFLVFLVYPL